MRCVVKEPGEPAKIIECGQPHELFDDAMGYAPFRRDGKQGVLFDDGFAVKELAPNIMHPMYKKYYELCGRIVIVGLDPGGAYCTLEALEADQVCVRLAELAVGR